MHIIYIIMQIYAIVFLKKIQTLAYEPALGYNKEKRDYLI